MRKSQRLEKGVYFSNCEPGQYSSCHLVVRLLWIHTRTVLKDKSAPHRHLKVLRSYEKLHNVVFLSNKKRCRRLSMIVI